jgi:transposase
MSTSRDARQLSQTAQEELRFRALSMVRGGLTQLAVAELLDVSRNAVGMWCRRAEAGGEDALRRGKRGNPSGPRLKGPEAAIVCNIIRDHCPDQVKLPFALWTREAVQRLIEERFGVHLALRTISDYLARWGFTAQKPVTRAYERNDAAILRWLNEEYPAVVARAKREGALVWWGDETGIRSRHQSGTSFSPRGKTPVTRATGKYFGCNLVSAITNRGELAFMLYDGYFNVEVFQNFLDRLLRQNAGRRVFLILDNLPVHHAKALQPWLDERAALLTLFFLPSYSPELNPTELLNHYLKANAIGRKRARTKTELVANVTNHLEGRAKTPEVVAAFFREKHVSYAA